MSTGTDTPANVPTLLYAGSTPNAQIAATRNDKGTVVLTTYTPAGDRWVSVQDDVLRDLLHTLEPPKPRRRYSFALIAALGVVGAGAWLLITWGLAVYLSARG